MYVSSYISETFNKLEVFIAHLRQLPTFLLAYKEYIHGVTVLKRIIFPIFLIFGLTEQKYGEDLNFSIQLLQCIETKL